MELFSSLCSSKLVLISCRWAEINANKNVNEENKLIYTNSYSWILLSSHLFSALTLKFDWKHKNLIEVAKRTILKRLCSMVTSQQADRYLLWPSWERPLAEFTRFCVILMPEKDSCSPWPGNVTKYWLTNQKWASSSGLLMWHLTHSMTYFVTSVLLQSLECKDVKTFNKLSLWITCYLMARCFQIKDCKHYSMK